MVQLHSTKTPCKSCLIGCCGHIQDGGLIHTFFQSVRGALGRDDIGLRFVISYHVPYEDDCPFFVPVVSNMSSIPENAILMVNMKFYNRQFIQMKQRIVKEERLKIKRRLLKALYEGGASIQQDIQSLTD